MLTLVLPGLRLPHHPGFNPLEGLALPGLAALLGRAARSVEPVDGDTWLRQQCGIEPAARAALTAVLDMPAEAPGRWLRADPVHLRVDRDRAVLFDADMLGLAQAEADALVAALNAHFAQDGLTFAAPCADRWYVSLATPLAIQTTPPERALGQDVRTCMPQGNDALSWHRIQNEIQMLLYTHPANDVREQAGQLPVNSVWLWGEGALPHAARSPWSHVMTDQVEVAAIAHAAQCPCNGLPRAFAVPPSNTLVWLDTLAKAARYGDLPAWRDELVRLDRDWFLPLQQAWRQGLVADMVIRLPASSGTHVATLTGADRWKCWRRPMGPTVLGRMLGA
jgi:hypothetical protein